MKTTGVRLMVLAAALLGCSSSNDKTPSMTTIPGGSSANTNMSSSPTTTTDTKPASGTSGSESKPSAQGSAGSSSQGMMASGQAGAPATDPGSMNAGQDPSTGTDPKTMPADNGEFPDIRGVGCKVMTGFPGDEACLAPPKPEEGMQIHVGPSNYDDPNEINKFVFHPGQESSQCWTVHTPNDQEIYFQGSVLSGRPGTHHIINTAYKPELQIADGGFTVCMDGGTGTTSNSIGALPGASKAYMPRRPVAPENAHLGRSVPAKTPMQADMHYFNFTNGDILREFWLNLYFIDKKDVTDTPNQIRGMGGLGWMIKPGTDHVYQYTAPITADGRIIELLGHYHAHGKRFTAYIKRASGEQEKVFEMYDYLDPLIFDYNSITKNPAFSDSMGGAVSGQIDVKAGDTLQWECHIVNDSMDTLGYTNEVKTGEMCNIWGSSVGNKIDKLASKETPF